MLSPKQTQLLNWRCKKTVNGKHREFSYLSRLQTKILLRSWQHIASGELVSVKRVSGEPHRVSPEVKALRLVNGVDVPRVVKLIEPVSLAPGNSALVVE